MIVFTVSLSRAAEGTVEVDFETTTEGTATEGVDFRSGKSLLVLFPEETTYDISVELFDDAVDDDGETVIVKLTGARLVQFDPVRRKEKRRKITIADDEATGTINNSDPVPRGWLARFGRTVAGHVTDAIEARLSGPAGGGSQATLGGQLLSLDGAAPGTPDEAGPETADGLTAFADRLAAHADGGAWQRREPAASRALTGRELLLGSSFHLALDGDVTTFMLGADAMWSRWLAGVALANCTGEGGYLDHAARAGHPDRGSGTLESTLTSVHPYARFQASAHLSLWGTLGYGTGDLTLTVKGRDGAADTNTDTDTGFRMAAAGAGGVLVAAGDTGGFELAARTDAHSCG